MRKTPVRSHEAYRTRPDSAVRRMETAHQRGCEKRLDAALTGSNPFICEDFENEKPKSVKRTPAQQRVNKVSSE